MKGCIYNNAECVATECIDTTLVTKNLNYCCCRADLCNREYKWIPVVTNPPDVFNHVTPESNIFMTVALIVSSVLVVIGLFIIFFWRHRKQSMFNEIPTVSTLLDVELLVIYILNTS